MHYCSSHTLVAHGDVFVYIYIDISMVYLMQKCEWKSQYDNCIDSLVGVMYFSGC